MKKESFQTFGKTCCSTFEADTRKLQVNEHCANYAESLICTVMQCRFYLCWMQTRLWLRLEREDKYLIICSFRFLYMHLYFTITLILFKSVVLLFTKIITGLSTISILIRNPRSWHTWSDSITVQKSGNCFTNSYALNFKFKRDWWTLFVQCMCFYLVACLNVILRNWRAFYFIKNQNSLLWSSIHFASFETGT